MLTYRQHSAIYKAQSLHITDAIESLGGRLYSCPSKSEVGVSYDLRTQTAISEQVGHEIELYLCECPAGKDGKFPCVHAAGLLLWHATQASLRVKQLEEPTKGGDEPEHTDPLLYLITSECWNDLMVG